MLLRRGDEVEVVGPDAAVYRGGSQRSRAELRLLERRRAFGGKNEFDYAATLTGRSRRRFGIRAHGCIRNLFIADSRAGAARDDAHALAGFDVPHPFFHEGDAATAIKPDQYLRARVRSHGVLEQIGQRLSSDLELVHALDGSELAEVEFLRRMRIGVNAGHRSGQDNGNRKFSHIR